MLAKRAEATTEKMMIIALQLFLKNHESRTLLAILKRFRFAWLSRSLCLLSILGQLKLLFRFRTVFHVVYSLRFSCQIVKIERLVQASSHLGLKPAVNNIIVKMSRKVA